MNFLCILFLRFVPGSFIVIRLVLGFAVIPSSLFVFSIFCFRQNNVRYSLILLLLFPLLYDDATFSSVILSKSPDGRWRLRQPCPKLPGLMSIWNRCLCKVAVGRCLLWENHRIVWWPSFHKCAGWTSLLCPSSSGGKAARALYEGVVIKCCLRGITKGQGISLVLR